MSDSPQLEGDSLAHRSAPSEPAMDLDDRDAGSYLAHLSSTLAAHGGGALSADLALDLVLNEIVEQARLATTATAASVGLVTADELICRATTGANAPGLGVRLLMHSGLVGTCVKSRQPQRCDDTEVDPRIDAAAYRNLEIRSILVVPVMSADQLLGIFQIFSPRADEFGDREVQTLQALSRRIVNSVQYATQDKAESSSSEGVAAVVGEQQDEREVELQSPLPAFSKVLAVAERGTDYWTSALTGLVVALALLLGWMVGHGGDETRLSAPAAVAATAKSSIPALQQPSIIPPALSIRTASPSAKRDLPAANAEGISNAGLVVYQRGKIIYQASPVKADQAKGNASEVIEMLPPATVSSLLLARVEPEYPDALRNSGVQGDVSMQIVVDKDGTVREIHVEDGNSQLAPAAVDAVRRWRFKPYQPKGAAQQFRSHIVVRFRLPDVPR